MPARLRRPLATLCTAALVVVAACGAAAVSDAEAPGTKPLQVTILDDVQNEPNPAASTRGRVTSSPAGIDCPGDCARDFPVGTAVAPTLTRKLASRGVFGNARGSRCATSAVCSLTIDGDPGTAQVAAALRPEAQLHTIVEGAGAVRIRPVETGSPAADCRIEPPLFGDLPDVCSPRYPNGTRVTLTAVPDAAVPGARFVRWSDYRCATRTTCAITVSGDVYLNAIFSPLTLTIAGGELSGATFGPVTASPPGGTAGLCTFADAESNVLPCSFAYPIDTLVTLRRDPALATSATDEWTGACTGRGVTCTVRMRENEYVRAGTQRTVDIPARTRQAFTLEYQGPGGGVIRLRSTSTLGSGTSFTCRKKSCARAGFRRGDTARITVSGSSRVAFVRWADTSVRRPSRLITVGTQTRIKAIFRRR